jgi:hypothetical protein
MGRAYLCHQSESDERSSDPLALSLDRFGSARKPVPQWGTLKRLEGGGTAHTSADGPIPYDPPEKMPGDGALIGTVAARPGCLHRPRSECHIRTYLLHAAATPRNCT